MKLTENILRQTIKEVIDEILGNDLEEQFADPKTVSHALDPVRPARRKPLPVVKGVPGRKRKGESAQQFKQRVLKKAQNEDLDETWDPVAGSAALDVPAMEEDLHEDGYDDEMEEELYEELDELDELDVPDIQPEVPEVKPPPVPPEVEKPVSGMTIKEQVSAKHDRIFESLVKKVTKR
jgi:hypothetical protein